MDQNTDKKPVSDQETAELEVVQDTESASEEESAEEASEVTTEEAAEKQSSWARFSKRTRMRIIIAAIIAALLGGIGIGAAYGSYAATSDLRETQASVEDTAASEDDAATEEEEAAESSEDTDAEAAEHTHSWETNYVLERVDAQTHTVEHPAEYEEQTTYHTVCNTCLRIIDGEASEHISQTGHKGYSTNVPVTNNVLVSEAWTETVVDEEAYDQLVADGERCSTCGATRNTSDS